MTSRDRRPLLELLAAGLLVLLSFGPILYDLAMAQGWVVPGQAMIGRDFLNSWAGGQLALQGRVGEVYSPAYMDAVAGLLGRGLSVHVFSYPPTLLLFLWPLGLVGYLPGLVVWTVLTAGAFLLAARPYLARAGIPPWVALLLPASVINLWAGHHGFVLAALWLAAFSAIPKRPAGAGLLIALLTLKPHMGLLIPVLLLVRRQWRVIAVASAGTLALIAASLLAFGWEPWASYLQRTATLQAGLLAQDGGLFFFMMPTPYSSFWVAFRDMPVAVIAHALIATAALAILVRAALSGTPWPELGLISSTASFLVLPYAFNYDMAVVGLGAILLLFDGRRRLDTIGRIFALIALGTPVLVLPLNYFGLPLLPVALLGFLHAQAAAYRPDRPAGPGEREPTLASADGQKSPGG